MTELLKQYESEITSISLLPSDGGKFEVIVNDKMVYSKLQTGRHTDPEELVKLVGDLLKEG